MKIKSINKMDYVMGKKCDSPVYLVWTNEHFKNRCKTNFHSFMSLGSVADWLKNREIYNKKQAFSMLDELKAGV